MFFNEIDFNPGTVGFDGFDIDPNRPLKDQEDSLREDMFQVNYGDKYTIDIGWKPNLNINGKFKIRIIKDYDWDNPIFYKKTNDLKILRKHVKECAEIVRNLLKNN